MQTSPFYGRNHPSTKQLNAFSHNGALSFTLAASDSVEKLSNTAAYAALGCTNDHTASNCVI